MQKLKKIFFDLDDTFFETHPVMRKKLADKGVTIGEGEYITPENGGIHFSEILNSPTFMLDARMRQYAKGTLEYLVQQGYSVGVCTHRGYHELGTRYSRLAMRGLLHVIDHFHVISPMIYPDKIAFLDSVHGAGNYLLVDDKPKWNGAEKLPDNIMLFNQGWNKHIDHPYRIESFQRRHFLKTLRQMQLTID
ncbi:hypothetical protein pEaSNUABM14_00212 [Erwinia phage pEa_SNUABM_14]|nr:hypothetical protein pEaSNUABM14_00212 [Erwinia phage pEa_SNUABM_14]